MVSLNVAGEEESPECTQMSWTSWNGLEATLLKMLVLEAMNAMQTMASPVFSPSVSGTNSLEAAHQSLKTQVWLGAQQEL